MRPEIGGASRGTRVQFLPAKNDRIFHIPLNMKSVFKKTMTAIREAHTDEGAFVVLSHDSSPWNVEHYFSVKHELPGPANVNQKQYGKNYVVEIAELTGASSRSQPV